MDVILNLYSERCAGCRHFYRHYVKSPDALNGPYIACWFGHCTHKRIKIRRCGDVCEDYSRRDEA